MEINWEEMKKKLIHSFYCDTNKNIGHVHS